MGRERVDQEEPVEAVEEQPPEGQAGEAEIDTRDAAEAAEGEEQQKRPQTQEELTQALEAAEAKTAQTWDQLVRSRAELENQTRRHQRELENAHKYALDGFVRELLQVWDSMELGLQAASDESTDTTRIREGMELTLKLFGDSMEKFNVERVDPEGEPFNPDLHQAMSMQQTEDVPPDTVVTVVQKGCMLNGRLVRPALVIVSQSPE